MEEKEFALEFLHRHPLKRVVNSTEETNYDWRSNWCYGCWRYLLPGDAVYGCRVRGCWLYCLHEECAEIARDIRHPAHPSHTLTPADLEEVDDRYHTPCAVCKRRGMYGFGYICKEGCKLWIHMRCAAGSLIFADEEHPQHELIHLRRPASFKCDACATITKEFQSSYACCICDYWIHQGCASLPSTKLFLHHPHHSLSLAFHPPLEYIKYNYTCDVCKGALGLRNWVYHCQLCRYIVHIKCANNDLSDKIKNDSAQDGDEVIFKAPINNMYEEIIKPFVERERGETYISPHDSEITNEYQFHHHNHPLSFITFPSVSTSHDRNKEEDDGDEDADNNERSEITCDGCTLPIEEISSNHHDDDGYMSCGKCKYFLHLACFNLPPHLPSHPLHQETDHNLRLQSSHKLTDWSYCSICNLDTNGLFYACEDEECDFKIDIKCASLPETIKHAGHSQHHHYLKRVTQHHQTSFCVACYGFIHSSQEYYKCNSCIFSVCYKCVLLPAQSKHRLENHWLPLTYDATVNRPGDFYCSNCEELMNPRSWMYHCRDCNQSFHPRCFPATSGRYRNFNFGQQHYQVSDHPNHSLRFQIISKKKRCNICRGTVYDNRGYQCTSCNFVMCFQHGATEVNQPIE